MGNDGLKWATTVVKVHHEVGLHDDLVAWHYHLAERVPLTASIVLVIQSQQRKTLPNGIIDGVG
ncbi:MAG: hypothetical protein AUI33_13530 [Ignavibacteria bacterium 13_1_40CM_2_61_4]|nr:MAG: hypothetical protein AUI33_13530 [Ignavibacteria bacterium 13_1_40CM_2_61_4]